MQKRKLIIIGISLLVLLSLFQLSDLVINQGSIMDASATIRLKYLILAYGMMLLVLVAFFFIQDFQNLVIVMFLFCLNVSIAFTLCEKVVEQLPVHKQNSLLVFHKLNAYQKNVEKSYLSLFVLTYLYAVIGMAILGIFLLVRCLLIKYYERQLMKELEAHIIPITYSSQLKGKDCTICLSEFEQKDENLYELKNCHHIYHAKCIRQWVNYSKTCPMCRNSIIPFRRSRESF